MYTTQHNEGRGEEREGGKRDREIRKGRSESN